MEWQAGVVFPTAARAWLPFPSLEAEDAEEGLRREGALF